MRTKTQNIWQRTGETSPELLHGGYVSLLPAVRDRDTAKEEKSMSQIFG